MHAKPAKAAQSARKVANLGKRVMLVTSAESSGFSAAFGGCWSGVAGRYGLAVSRCSALARGGCSEVDEVMPRAGR
jgi:hypothetical protein